jgi:hypothetical protein
MAKKVGQVNESTGRVETRRVKKAREADFDITIIDSRRKRIARNLWG